MKANSKNRRTCKEIQSLIPGYLSEKLTVSEAREFTGHIRQCRDCREEIEISYLLDQGIARVERGETVNLHADMERMLEGTEEAVMRLTQFRTAVYLVEMTAVFVLIAGVLITYLL